MSPIPPTPAGGGSGGSVTGNIVEREILWSQSNQPVAPASWQGGLLTLADSTSEVFVNNTDQDVLVTMHVFVPRIETDAGAPLLLDDVGYSRRQLQLFMSSPEAGWGKQRLAGCFADWEPIADPAQANHFMWDSIEAHFQAELPIAPGQTVQLVIRDQINGNFPDGTGYAPSDQWSLEITGVSNVENTPPQPLISNVTSPNTGEVVIDGTDLNGADYVRFIGASLDYIVYSPFSVNAGNNAPYPATQIPFWNSNQIDIISDALIAASGQTLDHVEIYSASDVLLLGIDVNVILG